MNKKEEKEHIVALCCYVDNNNGAKKAKRQTTTTTIPISKLLPAVVANYSLTFVIDTETTIGEYQNLLFGSCRVWCNGKLHKLVLFSADDLAKNQVQMIKAYAFYNKQKTIISLHQTKGFELVKIIII